MSARTFRAASSQAAFDMVQQELGPEAIIVSVREVPSGPAWQTWKNRDVEVLAIPSGVKHESLPEIIQSEEKPAPLPHQERFEPVTRPVQQTSEKPVLTKTEIEALFLKLASRGLPQNGSQTKTTPPSPVETQGDRKIAPPATHEPEIPPALRAIKKRLDQQGLDSTLTKKAILTCATSLSPRALENESALHNHLKQQLEAQIRVQPLDLRQGLATHQQMIICLVGPSGAGKTSTTAKIATLASQLLHKKVTWVCADTVRTGAIAIARAYTEPLNIPLHLAYTPEELHQAVSAEKDSELIVIDMPACNPRRENEVIDLGAFLTVISKRSTYLVAPATAKQDDLLEAAASFGPFNLNGLVISKLDETTTFGSSYNLAWRSQLPVVYFTTGTRILGDLLSAQAKTLPGLLLGESLS